SPPGKRCGRVSARLPSGHWEAAPRRKTPSGDLDAWLVALALDYPEAVEEHPWGDRAYKVRGKSFVFMSPEGGDLSITLKLPQSRDFALSFEEAEPTGYGLGKSGWVTVSLDGADAPPPDLLEEWIEESYRARAPKRLAALLDADSTG
ncbi:MAG: MmcQ/YjbR family DNA-binding protein, partial [Chloroflexi bacterium]|nr:MmcQ/YjbR family DNA-binding protein [Chloroflexota bacterium]